MVVAPVVIEIVLTIMLLVVNMPTLHILRMMQLTPFLLADHTIRFGLRFHVLHALLAVFQAHCLFLSQTAGCCTLLNSCLLIGLALIDTRHIGLRTRHKRQHDAECKQGFFDDFHVALLIPG